MQNNQILQGTPQWLEAKQSKISASEIFTLCLHYCRPELEAMNFNLREEKSFRSIQELFLKVKFNAKLSDIDPVHSQFGNGLEGYVAYRLGQELPQLKIKRSKEFIINEELHPLAACSPDGYVEIWEDEVFLPDFDNTCTIQKLTGKGAMELKTANFFANFNSDAGPRLNYLFQLTFQLMVMGLKWGCLAVLMPKEKEFDEPFFKGKVLRDIEIAEANNKDFAFGACYDLKYYIYPELPAFQRMIMKSLNAFQSDLDAYDTDPSVFPRNSEDLAGLQREKAMWGQVWPEHFGTLSLEEGSEIDDLVGKRMIAASDELFARVAKENYTNQIIAKCGKYVEVIGSTHRMKFAKDGSARFSNVGKRS